MTLTDVFPNAQALSRVDKIRLIQLLAQDLERDEGELIDPNRSYQVFSPDTAFAAAAVLLQSLEDHKVQP